MKMVTSGYFLTSEKPYVNLGRCPRGNSLDTELYVGRRPNFAKFFRGAQPTKSFLGEGHARRGRGSRFYYRKPSLAVERASAVR